MQKLKKFFIRFLVVLLAVQGTAAAWLLSPSAVQAAGTQEVVINEVMWMGSEVSTADEWIELYNSSSETVDLTNWTLTNVSSGGDLVIPSGAIGPGEYFLVSHFSEDSASSALNVTPDYATTTLQIGNSCVGIALLDALLVQVDEMGCDGNAYFGGINTTTQAALERTNILGDGAIAGSWQTSSGQANLDVTAVSTLATPKFVNDMTPATTSGAVVNDGPAADLDFTIDGTSLTANWSGFADVQSGVMSYLVGVGTAPDLDDVVAFASTTSLSEVMPIPAWGEGATLFVTVKAVNGVNLESTPISSDGITLDTLDPNPPTSLQVVDTPNDNGGSLTATWLASSSLDVASYQVNYRVEGTSTWSSMDVGLNLSLVISGLENSPTTYEVMVEAIDFNDQRSTGNPVETSQAHDNLAPVLDETKVVVGQNQPGSADTVHGTAGASNEPNVFVYVFDRNPADPAKQIVNSVLSGVDGSFSLLGVGDNQNNQLWVQLVDAAGNSSSAKMFSNDIVAPSNPTLQQVTSTCVGDNCRVELNWQNGGPDTAYYKVGYSASPEIRTMELTSTSAVLDLATDKHYTFRVYAYDQYGNVSTPSNDIHMMLTRGVKTTATWVNGQQTTVTTAISGAREVVYAEKGGLTGTLVPKAQAQGNGNGDDTEVNGTDETATEADTEDWTRILVVALLLLVIAGSFYALSRSVKGPATPPAPIVTEEAKPKTRKRRTGASSRRGRGRPRS